MVSGKPPRHSKSKAEPVTIDLDAKDVKAVSADVDAAETDKKPGDKTPETAADSAVSDIRSEATATGNAAPIWDQPKETPSRARAQCRESGRRGGDTEGGEPG